MRGTVSLPTVDTAKMSLSPAARWSTPKPPSQLRQHMLSTSISLPSTYEMLQASKTIENKCHYERLDLAIGEVMAHGVAQVLQMVGNASANPPVAYTVVAMWILPTVVTCLEAE